MRTLFCLLTLATCSSAWGHVPALLLPLKGTPITSYFIGQSDVSRAIYSELTEAQDIFVLHFSVAAAGENLFEILTPVCPQIPSYEEYQPSALLLKGDLPWKTNGESNADFIARLEKSALSKLESNYAKGSRPQFFEEFAKQSYWVGGKIRVQLEPGLYSVVVFNRDHRKGNFTLGINEKEAWTPDLYKYAGEVVPKIAAGICDPRGFSGTIVTAQ